MRGADGLRTHPFKIQTTKVSRTTTVGICSLPFKNNFKLTEALISFSQRLIRYKRFEEFWTLLRFAISGNREFWCGGLQKPGRVQGGLEVKANREREGYRVCLSASSSATRLVPFSSRHSQMDKISTAVDAVPLVAYMNHV